jgi:hypothetical protein
LSHTLTCLIPAETQLPVYSAPLDLAPRLAPEGVLTRRNPSPGPPKPPVPGLLYVDPPPHVDWEVPGQFSTKPSVGAARATVELLTITSNPRNAMREERARGLDNRLSIGASSS